MISSKKKEFPMLASQSLHKAISNYRTLGILDPTEFECDKN